MAWLDTHPPARSQQRKPRREKPSGVIVVHTAENTPDTVALDGGAEAVANFIRNREDPGSYHDLCDSDSCINLVGYANEAFHDGTGSNPHSYSVSGATKAEFWPLAPKAWRDGCVREMAHASARYAKWIRHERGIIIPARRITRAQSVAKLPGFISHAERDPARREDPGEFFPWEQFLDEYARAMGTEEDDLLSALTDAEQRELLRKVRAIYDETAANPDNASECRLKDTTILVRDLHERATNTGGG